MTRVLAWFPLLARLLVATALLSVSCRCGGSDRARPSAPEAEAKLEAGAARFQLPAEFSGGENDAGGHEYTDGEIALMIGHASSTSAPNLDAFFDARVAVLERQGTLSERDTGARTVAGKPARWLAATVTPEGGAPLSVRLLVVEPNPSERLSLLMVGERGKAAKISRDWDVLVRSIEFTR